MKISDLLRTGILELTNRPSKELDAELLLANALAVPREYLFVHGEEEADRDLAKLFLAYIERAKKGEPISYITLEKEFYGLNFFVDKRVLIPRPETEMLTSAALDFMKKSASKSFRILDIGTGSGNIAVSIAASCEDSTKDLFIDAIDISEDALTVARLNAEIHNVSERIHFFQSDLLENVDENSKYDLIVANLPYIPENGFVEKDVRAFEPNGALFAGSDGLLLYKKLFQALREKKIKFDLFLGEFGSETVKDMGELLNKYFGQNWKIENDLAQLPRMFIINQVYAR